MNARHSGFERGFTLIELLLALALFSIMSLLAWRGLDTVLQSRAAVETPGRAALELAAAWMQLEADLSAARLIAPLPGSGSTLPRAPYIVASAQKIALLRAPAQCAGCWEGVVYDMVAGDSASVLRRRTTTVYTDAGAALTALEILAATTAASAESCPQAQPGTSYCAARATCASAHGENRRKVWAPGWHWGQPMTACFRWSKYSRRHARGASVPPSKWNGS